MGSFFGDLLERRSAKIRLLNDRTLNGRHARLKFRKWVQYPLRRYRDVLLTLQTYRPTGAPAAGIWPAHATLAERAGCCIRTVQRALQLAERLGLVSWTERRVKAGWRWLRTSNTYRLELPDAAVQPGLRPVFRRPITTGQNVRGGENRNPPPRLSITHNCLNPPRLHGANRM